MGWGTLGGGVGWLAMIFTFRTHFVSFNFNRWTKSTLSHVDFVRLNLILRSMFQTLSHAWPNMERRNHRSGTLGTRECARSGNFEWVVSPSFFSFLGADMPPFVEKKRWWKASWWQLKCFLNFHPDFLGGNDPIMTVRICPSNGWGGWFNHQLEGWW